MSEPTKIALSLGLVAFGIWAIFGSGVGAGASKTSGGPPQGVVFNGPDSVTNYGPTSVTGPGSPGYGSAPVQ